MAAHYDPRRVLRQVSNELLSHLFNEKLQLPIGIDWTQLKQTEIEPIFNAWQSMEDGDRRTVEVVLQDIHAMASEEGVKVLVRDGDTWGKDLRVDLDSWDSRYDKAMWAFLNHHDVWSLAVQFARADQLEGTRPWVKRANVSNKPAKIDDATMAEFETALCAFYREREGRGHICRVHHLLRNNQQHYFFVNLSDYADTYDKLDPEKHDFVRESEQRAFAIVFVYEPSAKTLEVYAKGGKRVTDALMEIFARVILGIELGEEYGNEPYQLNLLLNPSFDFQIESTDGLADVRIRRMRLSVKGNRKRRITLEGNPDGGVNDVHDMMAKYIDPTALPMAIVDVDQVTLCFRFKQDGPGRAKGFSFNLSSPNGCNLKSLREEYRLIGEKYLKKWAVDCG